MFCPHCGAQASSGTARFCRECGGEIGAATAQTSTPRDSATNGAPGSANQSWGAPRHCMTTTNVYMKGSMMKPLLIAAGLLLLLPLAIPLFFGAIVASVFAGVALVGFALKLAPLLAVGILIYWALNRQRRIPHSSH